MKRFNYSKDNPLKLGKVWEQPSEQYVNWGDDSKIRISTLIEQCKDLPVVNIPIEHLGIARKVSTDPMFIRDFVQHCHHVLAADLRYPIILDYDGEILDGTHRVIRAILEGRKAVQAKRMTEAPHIEKS